MDRLGTFKVETNASQSVSATRQFDAFGNPTGTTGTPTTPFGFAGAWGYQQDPDSGLMLLGHRYYDPSTGRFLTRDPAKDGRNWYGYCGNDPTDAVDPSGLLALWKEILLRLAIFFGAPGESRAPPSGEIISEPPALVSPEGPPEPPDIISGEGGVVRIGGVMVTVIEGADAGVGGIAVVIKYRRRIQAYIDALDADDSGGDDGSNTGTGGPPAPRSAPVRADVVNSAIVYHEHSGPWHVQAGNKYQIGTVFDDELGKIIGVR